MANVMLRKKIDVQTPAVSGVKRYARKIWLAGLGAYARVGSEGGEYVKELVKSGQRIESKSKKVAVEQVGADNSHIHQVKSYVSSVKDLVEVQLANVESAFDSRVASALNRIGIASKHDVETLSAKLEELTALLERVARKH